MPQPTKLGYHISRLEKWRAARLKTSQGGDKQNGKNLHEKKLIKEIKKLEQEIRGKRLKNDKYESKLIELDVVVQWIATRLLRIKQRLESMPNEGQVYAPPEFRGEFRGFLESFVFELLTEMSGWQFNGSDE